MKDENKTTIEAENIIIVDADYIDEVTGILLGGFEKSLGRKFPKADIAKWTDCVALDGGLMPGDNKTAVIMFHDKNKNALVHFVPSEFEKDLNEQAFKDNLGEFVYTSIPVEKEILRGEMIKETVSVLCAQKNVKRITMVANVEQFYKDIEEGLKDNGKDKDKENKKKEFSAVTMHLKKDWDMEQNILAFSIMHTLGITDEDMKKL